MGLLVSASQASRVTPALLLGELYTQLCWHRSRWKSPLGFCMKASKAILQGAMVSYSSPGEGTWHRSGHRCGCPLCSYVGLWWPWPAAAWEQGAAAPPRTLCRHTVLPPQHQPSWTRLIATPLLLSIVPLLEKKINKSNNIKNNRDFPAAIK